MVDTLGLNDVVRFLGRIPRKEIPELMREHDLFVLPSIWEEPLSRVMQEAMASGLAVVGTDTGGSTEGLVHEETGLIFPAGDAAALATELQRLIDNPALARNLAQAGRKMAEDMFDFDRVIDEIEAYCLDVVTGKDTSDSDG